jgi:hypothetical protein
MAQAYKFKTKYMAKSKKSAIARRNYLADKRKENRARTVAAARAMVVPGFTRLEGNYGRYLQGGELKYLDTVITHATVSDTGSLTESLNNIPEGTSESQRIGRKVIVKGVYLKGNAILKQQTAGMSSHSSRLRIIMYLDKQCNGGAATVDNLLKNPTGGQLMNAFRNLENSQRFRMLCDYTVSLDTGSNFWSGATWSNSEVNKTVKCNKGKLSLPLEFSGTTGATGEIRSNNIGLLLIPDHGEIEFQGTVRVRYSDN